MGIAASVLFAAAAAALNAWSGKSVNRDVRAVQLEHEKALIEELRDQADDIVQIETSYVQPGCRAFSSYRAVLRKEQVAKWFTTHLDPDTWNAEPIVSPAALGWRAKTRFFHKNGEIIVIENGDRVTFNDEPLHYYGGFTYGADCGQWRRILSDPAFTGGCITQPTTFSMWHTNHTGEVDMEVTWTGLPSTRHCAGPAPTGWGLQSSQSPARQ